MGLSVEETSTIKIRNWSDPILTENTTLKLKSQIIPINIVCQSAIRASTLKEGFRDLKFAVVAPLFRDDGRQNPRKPLPLHQFGCENSDSRP